MRFMRIAVVLALIMSLVGNFILYNRVERRRAQMTINGEKITKRDYHDWLERHGGVQAQAALASYRLIMQAAKKDNLIPDDNEIEQELKNMADGDPRVAVTFDRQPWVRMEQKEKKQMEYALVDIAGKDVKVTPDELTSYFARNNGKWDIPDKVYVKAIQCTDAKTAENVAQLMSSSKGQNLQDIARQMAPRAGVVGVDGTWALARATGQPSRDAQIQMLFECKPGDVKVLSSGNARFAVRVDKIIPGKKVTLDEVKPKVMRAVKAMSATPAQEVLQKLWDQGEISTDPAEDKAQVEHVLFPQRTGSKSAEATQ